MAADTGHIALALMEGLWANQRTIGAAVLFERLERDLDELKAQGEEIDGTAQYYVSYWLNARWLERRLRTGASEEEYELSAAAAAAIRLVRGIAQPRQAATESRLAVVMQQLQRLAQDSDADPTSRMAALRAERDRIDAEMEAIADGRAKPLEDERAIERTLEVLALADELVADFRRVRNDFDLLHRQLREKIVQNDSTRGEVLDSLFEGVDLISDSESGKTFAAFWRLLMDPEQGAALESALDQVASRRFATRLSPGQLRALRRLTKSLLDEGRYVHDVLQQFARSLKQFVQTRQYEEQQRVTQLLREAQQAALSIKEEIAPTDRIGMTLEVARWRAKSLSQWTLYDPSLHTVTAGMAEGEAMEMDLTELSRLFAESDIDVRTLRKNVRAALEETSQVSIGDLMTLYPARQGLATVVGYLQIGGRYGVRGEEKEGISWQTRHGTARMARISAVYFTRESTRGME